MKPCLLASALCLAALGCSGPGSVAGAAAELRPAPAASSALSSVAATLDAFETLEPWRARASEGVDARLEALPGVEGKALGLSFDFRGGAGHASARRPLELALPDNYELSFDLRGDAAPNDLELKLIDPSGDNVWWFRLRDATFTREWRRVVVKKRQLEFAWGPTKLRELRRAQAVEFVVARGTGGGRGSIAIDRLELRKLPPPPATPPSPVARASVSEPAGAAALAVDGRPDTAWTARSGTLPAALWLDLGYQREFGGLTLCWAPGAHASDYDVAVSRDQKLWTTLRRVRGSDGGVDALRLPEAEARYLRLTPLRGPGSKFALAEAQIEPLEFGATLNDFVGALAQRAPRGRFPRAFTGEQSYWTLVALDGALDSGLVSEDGALELGRGSPSIEPFVVQGERVFSWADVTITHALGGGYLPMPRVVWNHPEWRLELTTWAAGSVDAPVLRARYSVENLSERPLELRLVLALRPFQVNPPTQTLNLAGGVSPIRTLRWDGSVLAIDGVPRIQPIEAPDQVELAAFEQGAFPERLPQRAPLAREFRENSRAITDPTGLASGTFSYALSLPPRGRVNRSLTTRWPAPSREGREQVDAFALEREEREIAQRWREALNRVEFSVPAAANVWIDSLRSSLAHILMSRVGPMLKPGPRSYARSWIRDGAMMSEALLRLGHAAVARDYLAWYAPFQFESGKVPCAVDARGADPVAEHDSSGQFIFLAAEVHRYTGDRALAQSVWPAVAAAAHYLEALRQSERGPTNQSAGRRQFFGLLPPSISHEGYSDKPAYAYWDDFWGLIGYQDAVYLARVLGERAAETRLEAQRDEFQRELLTSLRASASEHAVGFLPGAADRGDFDPTSTTIALAPGRERATLPADLLQGTFERYYEDFRERRAGRRAWQVYTPYELRSVGSFVRLGWRARAQELLEFFLADRRPAAWNQWAEVISRLPRQPHFIGDMPHAWVASDFIRSILDCFAYERPEDQALVIAAGIPPAWLEGDGIRIDHLNTSSGRMGYALRIDLRKRVRLELEIWGDAPPGGFVLPWPLPSAGETAYIDAKPVRWDGRELRIPSPSHVSIHVTRPRL